MKHLASFIVFLSILAACKKQADRVPAFSGVWVETSLRVDTLDFDYGNLIDYAGGYDGIISFRTNTYTDSVLNPNFPVNHSTQYEYYFENNKTLIRLRSLLSSNSLFSPYNFMLSADGITITVEKFYQRRQLPAIITFRRI